MNIENESFKLKRDSFQWVLSLSKEGTHPKTKEPTITWRDSYHSTLDQAANSISNHCAQSCDDLDELRIMMAEFCKVMAQSLKEATQ